MYREKKIMTAAERQRARKAAAFTGIGLAAGLMVTTVSVACLAYAYMKSLMGIDYIADEDVYEEE